MERASRPEAAASLVLGLGVLLGLVTGVTSRGDEGAKPGQVLLLADTFEGELSSERWEPLREHDVRAERISTDQGQLLLGLDTLGTDDATVKLRGVRSRQAWELGPGKQGLEIEVTLDWNDQANGCYLTAGVALVPESVNGAPHRAREALAFEFVGVPPGKNVRPFLWTRREDALRPLYTEGWPQARREERTGRHVRRAGLRLEVSASGITLAEDGRERFRGAEGLSGKVKLLLFVTGHSNYPLRTIRFDDLKVRTISLPDAPIAPQGKPERS